METFWISLQKLVDENEIIIDRPKNSVHPRYPDYIYPFDYGYLKNTKSSDGDGIDCWQGSLINRNVTGLVVVVDPIKADSEIKILIGCTEHDMNLILKCHQRGTMNGILIKK